MNRCVILVVLVLASCVTQAERDGERKARAQLINAESVRTVQVSTCSELAKLGTPRADWENCFGEVIQLAKKVADAEQSYRSACRKCASAEKCESELRRIRAQEGSPGKETACPD